VRRCLVRAIYLSASAVAGKTDRGAMTSVRPLPYLLPLPGKVIRWAMLKLGVEEWQSYLCTQVQKVVVVKFC